MTPFSVGQLLRIFVAESETWHGRSVYTAIVEVLRQHGVAGASVFRGIGGFGAHRNIHLAKVLSFRCDLPILIEVVDTEDKIAQVIPIIDGMVKEGAMTLERVEFRRFPPQKKVDATNETKLVVSDRPRIGAWI